MREKAIVWISQREYSKKELTERLSSICDDKAQILDVIEYLIELNYLCDERFSDALIKSKHMKFGDSYLIYMLKQHNIDKNTVSELLKKYPSELERASVICNKKNNLTYQKLYQYLLNKGFSTQSIQKALQEQEKKSASCSL